MGIYSINCSICDKPFLWFSGNKFQFCSKCVDKKFGGSYFEVYQRFKNPEKNGPVACYHAIGINEADSYDEAYEILIKRGVPEDEIVKKDFT